MDVESCKFDMGWGGICKAAPASDGDGYCERHAGVRCCSCGEKATRECCETGIQFVCGSPLCDDCDHGPARGGWFGLGGGHHRKADIAAMDSYID
jgi:hypothetical protein